MYTCTFISIWSFNYILLLTAVTWLCITTNMWSVIFAFAAVVMSVYMRSHRVRTLIRSGTWFSTRIHYIYPCTARQFQKQLAAIHGTPTVIGSGWGFFLKRRIPKPPYISMVRFRGHMPENKNRWAAGTTITEVVNEYKKKNVTFPSLPTQNNITLGAWFACGNHGNSGDVGRGSASALRDATVIDMWNNELLYNCDYSAIRQMFDKNPSRYCIIDVAFHKLVPNKYLLKQALRINDAITAGQWLNSSAYLRVCFIGAAKKHATGIRWTETHVKPEKKCCGRCNTYFQADICSAACGCSTPIQTEIVTLSAANIWTSAIPPIDLLFIAIGAYRNVEIIFRLTTPLDGILMWRLLRACKKIHNKHGGRTELRYGSGPIFLDVVMKKQFHLIFHMLQESFNVQKCALHIGKHIVSTYPLSRVTMGEMYNIPYAS